MSHDLPPLPASARTVTRYAAELQYRIDGGPFTKPANDQVVVLYAEVAPLLTALADHAQAVQTLAAALREIHAHPTYSLDQILAVADRLDALAGSETP